MLVLFSVKNFASFKEEACLDMRAVKAYKEHPYNLHTLPNGEQLLKVAAIYGANASGKSNFVKAYSAFVNILRDSFNNPKDDENALKRYYNPYLFDSSYADSDTEFSGVFTDEKYQYEYGFSYNAEKISAEWLYRTTLNAKRKVRVMIFERRDKDFKFGPSIEKFCDKYRNDINDDVLVLSFFNRIKLQTDAFNTAYHLVCTFPAFFTFSKHDVISWMKMFFKREDDKQKSDLLAFCKSVDIRVKDFETRSNNDDIRIFFIHEKVDGRDCPLPVELESEGTRKAMVLYLLARDMLDYGVSLFLDELNMQLHPLLTRYIVNLFHAQKGQGQLIYTTHDTTLLDNSFFRRDEVWFVDRAETGESSLYSLSEFATRKDASFESEYLGGAYGGIPILQSTLDCEV